MRFIFRNKDIELLYTERKNARRYPVMAINGFFRVMTIIRNATDERDLRAFRSLNSEALKGNRSHQNSMRLNQPWRLIVERTQDENGRLLWIVDIEDYD